MPEEASSRRLDPRRLGDTVDRLYRAALGLCGNVHDAEDLVQETYARALSRPRLLRRADDLPYLMRVLHNLHIDRLRAERRRPRPVALELVADPRARPTDPRAPEAGWQAREVLAAIAQLPGDQRAAVVAVDLVGLTYAEAARALGAKEATITTRLHRGRRRLADALGPPPEDLR